MPQQMLDSVGSGEAVFYLQPSLTVFVSQMLRNPRNTCHSFIAKEDAAQFENFCNSFCTLGSASLEHRMR